jgi:hypothetical protein
MKFIFAVLVSALLVGPSVAADISTENEYLLNNYMGALAGKVQLGTMFTRMEKKVTTATFDPSANTSERTVAAHTIGLQIPDDEIITRVFYEVLTTFTSAADTATIALHLEGANDVVSAIDIDDAGDPWDAGFHEGIQTGAAATMIKTTAARYLTATVGVQALTAGKMNVYVEYIVSP